MKQESKNVFKIIEAVLVIAAGIGLIIGYKKDNKVLKIISVSITIAVAIGIGIAIGESSVKLDPKITELSEKIKELEVEKERLEKENHRLVKRLESVIYHLGQVVEKARNKSYQL